MSKTYPDHTLENALRDKGIDCRCMWEMKGPPMTQISHMVAYLVGARVIIVQTFIGGGWQVYFPSEEGRVDATVDEVIRRCKPPEAA